MICVRAFGAASPFEAKNEFRDESGTRVGWSGQVGCEARCPIVGTSVTETSCIGLYRLLREGDKGWVLGAWTLWIQRQSPSLELYKHHIGKERAINLNPELEHTWSLQPILD